MTELQNPPVAAPESNLVPGMSAPIAPLIVPSPQTWTGGFPNIADTSGPPPVANMEPPTWVYDFDPASGVARATFNGNVRFTSGGSATAGVTSFNTRTGDVTLSLTDVTGAGGAPLASPAMTGTPTVPTAAPGTSTTQAASTAFVGAAIAANAGVVTFNGRNGAVTLSLSDIVSAGGAPTASPALTGTPTTPTASVSDNSSTIASTAYVNNYAAQNLVLSFNGRRGAVTLSLSDITTAGGAPLTSPTLLGVPSAPTAAPGTSTTQLATCAFVENAVTAASSGVVTWNGRSGVVSMTLADVTSVGGAPLLSPALTGTPTAPTQTAGNNTSALATCAFVETAIGNMAPVVASFNGRTGAVTLQLTDVTSVGGAPLAAPVFTGNASSPTPTAGDNSTRIATTAFVTPAIASAIAPLATTAQLAGYLPLTGGTLTGTLNGTSINASYGITAGNLVSSTGTNAGLQFQDRTSSAEWIWYSTGGNANLYGNGNNLLTVAGVGGMTTGAGNFNGPIQSIGSTAELILQDRANGANSFAQIHNGGGLVWQYNAGPVPMSIDSIGNLSITAQGIKPGGGPWVAPSARELKTAIEPYKAGLATVLQLNPVAYEYAADSGLPSGQLHVGLIFDECPHMPEMHKKAPIRAGEEQTLVDGLDHGPLVFALINAVKELTARLDMLENAGRPSPS